MVVIAAILNVIEETFLNEFELIFKIISLQDYRNQYEALLHKNLIALNKDEILCSRVYIKNSFPTSIAGN